MDILRHFGLGRASRVRPELSRGRRVYAIGDVHGCADLLGTMLATIEQDDRTRGRMRTDVVLLGDLVDRGPDTRQVLTLARTPLGWAELHSLRGNHEAILLDILDGAADLFTRWVRVGGRETLESLGIPGELLDDDDFETVRALMHDALSPGELAFLRALPSHLLIDDYLFVHAGIRPGLPLDRQEDCDLLWIREPFLSSRKRHQHFVVHGHTPSDEVDCHFNRAGLDLGAFKTGRLAAMGFEGTARWVIEVDRQTVAGQAPLARTIPNCGGDPTMTLAL